ncbi:MAG: ATP-binding protein [Alphaproteobacteria bacterium]
MFNGPRKHLYQQILQADPRACQVRTYDNKVLYTNAKGTLYFGLQEDPFAFLSEYNPKQLQSDLLEAYQHHLPFFSTFENGKNILSVQLVPLVKAILIAVTDKTLPQKSYQELESQLDVLAETVRGLETPLYLTDKDHTLLYVNPAFMNEVNLDLPLIIGKKKEQILKNTLGWSEKKLNAAAEELILGSQKQMLYEAQDAYASPVPMLLLDPKTHSIVGGNTSACVILDKELKNLCNYFFDDLWESSAQKNLKNLWEKISNNLFDGKPVELRLNLDDFTQNKTFHAFFGKQKELITCSLFDITPRKKLEMQVAQDQKMQALGQLTGGIAHDFNNILTAIIGFTDLLLQRHPMGDESFSDLMQIKGNAKKAAGLVGRLLTFSRKTPTRTRLISVHDSFVDLTPLIQRSLAPVCSLDLEMKRHLGCIRLDPNQLTQIFLNLAVNAKDAMSKGGIFHISITREKIKKARFLGTETLPVGDYIKITAHDSGIGIAAENLPHIFEPFYTTKEKTAESGTGLGLSTVYGIIHSAGGFIYVDSEQNVGTTFSIYLPRFEPEPNVQQAPKTNTIPNIFLPSQSGTIILADDEDGIRLLVGRVLKMKGFEVIECTNANEALSAVKTLPEAKLLITDMVMPGMNGEQLIEQALKTNPYLKAILMSGYSNQFERHTGETKLPFSFISKPFVLTDLLVKIQEVLEAH